MFLNLELIAADETFLLGMVLTAVNPANLLSTARVVAELAPEIGLVLAVVAIGQVLPLTDVMLTDGQIKQWHLQIFFRWT